MAKKRLTPDEEQRWRKIVYIDDKQAGNRTKDDKASYVYHDGAKHSSWWTRLKDRLTKH